MQTHTRSVCRLLGMLAVLGWQTASAVDVSWYRQPGSALSITSNASGSVWIVGTDRQSDGSTTDTTYTNGTARNSSSKMFSAARTLGSHDHRPALDGERSE